MNKDISIISAIIVVKRLLTRLPMKTRRTTDGFSKYRCNNSVLANGIITPNSTSAHFFWFRYKAWKFETEQGFKKSKKNLRKFFLALSFSIKNGSIFIEKHNK